MVRKVLGALAAAVLALPLAAGAAGEQQKQGEPEAFAPPTQAELKQIKTSDVFAELHAFNQAEIAEAEIAARKAQDPQVKQFARQVAQDHQQFDRQLTAMARQNGWSLEPSFNLTNAALAESERTYLSELEKKSGPAFDQTWLGGQAAGHIYALEVLDLAKEANVGDAQTKQLLSQAEQKIQGHQQQNERLIEQSARNVAQIPSQQQGG